MRKFIGLAACALAIVSAGTLMTRKYRQKLVLSLDERNSLHDAPADCTSTSLSAEEQIECFRQAAQSARTASQGEPSGNASERARTTGPSEKALNKSLKEAAAQGDEIAVKKFLSAGANVNDYDCTPNAATRCWEGAGQACSCTALQYAMEDRPNARSVSVSVTLLENGADPYVRNKYGVTPLIEAAGNINEEKISEPLIRALIRAGIKADAKRGLAPGAYVNAADQNGVTALMDSAEHDNSIIVKLLLNNGANAKAVNKSGGTALMQAAQDTAYLSVNEDYKNRRVEDIHALIDAGADVNAKTESGETALAAAIREYIPKKSDGAIRALLDAKADPNIADSKGRTPLMLLAAQCNWDCAHDAIAALLVRADINLRDQDGATALMLAVKGNQQYNVNTLLGAHADPNLPDKDGKTPLWWANNPRAYPFSPGKNPVVIRALSDAGAQ